MSLSLPPSFTAVRAQQTLDLLENEVLAEKASSLGHHGRLVEQALSALRRFDAGSGHPAEERAALLNAAAREVWKFLVQRELCGLRDQKEVVRHYGIPPEVMARLGVI